MKKFLFLALFTGSTLFGVNWTTDYPQAVSDSKASGKPVLLFFTGSDWCGWCKRLDKEAFKTAEFNSELGDKLIYVELDYPMSKSLDGKTTAQNNALKTKHAIKGYPTVILIDGNEKVLGRTGYKAGGGKAYADHLKTMIR